MATKQSRSRNSTKCCNHFLDASLQFLERQTVIENADYTPTLPGQQRAGSNSLSVSASFYTCAQVKPLMLLHRYVVDMPAGGYVTYSYVRAAKRGPDTLTLPISALKHGITASQAIGDLSIRYPTRLPVGEINPLLGEATPNFNARRGRSPLLVIGAFNVPLPELPSLRYRAIATKLELDAITHFKQRFPRALVAQLANPTPERLEIFEDRGQNPTAIYGIDDYIQLLQRHLASLRRKKL